MSKVYSYTYRRLDKDGNIREYTSNQVYHKRFGKRGRKERPFSQDRVDELVKDYQTVKRSIKQFCKDNNITYYMFTKYIKPLI